jgi:hypothetical protein
MFGPEDGSLDRAVLARCHRFLVIPTRHCTKPQAGDGRPGGAELGGGAFDEPDQMADAVGVTCGGEVAAGG